MKRAPLDILQERAQQLAERPAPEQQGKVALTMFLRGGQVYGVRTLEVEGAGRLRDLSPAPGAPAWMLGAIQHRGRVLSLVDLPLFWNMETSGVADLPTYIVVSDGISQVGILVEELRGVQDVDAVTTTYQGVERSGLTEIARQAGNPILVLSAPALLQDSRLLP
ncbi:MAG: chemotaxis protein CheW [Myxococcaceae bacterium]